MNKLSLSFPLFFCFLISLFLVSFVPSSQATGMFNWVKNSGFDAYTNICEGGGAESGEFNSGVLYGNWSGTGSFSSTIYYSGVKSFKTTGSGYINYTLKVPILGNNIVNFTAWLRTDGTGSKFDIFYYYTDGSSTNYQIQLDGNDQWYKKDLKSQLSGMKYLSRVRFKLWTGSANNYHDEVVMLASFGDEGQAVLGTTTYPWYITETDEPDYGISFSIGHDNLGAGYIGWDCWLVRIQQDVQYLDSDDVVCFDLWAYTPSVSNVGIRLGVTYSDGSLSTKVLTLTAVGSWQHLIFSGCFAPNKYVIRIEFSLHTAYSQYVYFDDVGLWSTLNIDQVRFSYVFSPSPLAQRLFRVSLSQGVSYVFHGYLYDENGTKTENGTFVVSSDRGVKTGVITNGHLYFTIEPRRYSTNYSEIFSLVIDVELESLLVKIEVVWVYEGDAGTGGLGFYDMPFYIQFVVLFVVIGMPALVMGGYGAKSGWGLQGLLFGSFIGLGIGVIIGLIPFWFVFLMAIFLVLFLYGLARRS